MCLLVRVLRGGLAACAVLGPRDHLLDHIIPVHDEQAVRIGRLQVTVVIYIFDTFAVGSGAVLVFADQRVSASLSSMK